MPEKTYTKEELKKEVDIATVHAKILSKLDSIEEQTIKTNGRVSSLEEEMKDSKDNIAKALNRISIHEGVLTGIKSEKDKAKDLELEALRKSNKEWIKYVIWLFIVILSAVATATGVINFNLPLI